MSYDTVVSVPIWMLAASALGTGLLLAGAFWLGRAIERSTVLELLGGMTDEEIKHGKSMRRKLGEHALELKKLRLKEGVRKGKVEIRGVRGDPSDT